MRNRMIARLFSVLIGTTGLVGTSQAGYTGLTIFGDSLSDTGNVLSLASVGGPNFPTFPGASGRFSDGPVWTETLATGLGIPSGARSSNLLLVGDGVVIPTGPQGGTNYAYGGARTGLAGAAGQTTGVFGQLAAWNGSGFAGGLTRTADSAALYVLMAGANDLRNIRTVANPGDREVALSSTLANISQAMFLLAEAGARHFMVSSLPDLGKTPEAVAGNSTGLSTELTLRFNADLAAAMDSLDVLYQIARGIDLDIRMLDFYGLSERIYADAVGNHGDVYGITNVTSPCITPIPTPNGPVYFTPQAFGTNCDSSAFSDPLHPTAAVHALLGQLAITTAVPEPGSLALVLGGLFGFALVGLRRRV